jgi:hypothetical protein
MKKNKETVKKITLSKEGKYWIVKGLKHGSGKHRLFSTDLQALEVALTIWPGRECVYG